MDASSKQLQNNSSENEIRHVVDVLKKEEVIVDDIDIEIGTGVGTDEDEGAVQIVLEYNALREKTIQSCLKSIKY